MENSSKSVVTRAGSRIKILFVAEAVTLAHISRPFLLAKCLDTSLFDVFFAADSHYDHIVPLGDFKRSHINSPSPLEFRELLDRGGCLFPEEKVAKYVERDLEIIDHIKPDLIVGDLRISLAVSAKFADIPYINIINSYWSPFAVDKRLPLPGFRQFRKLGLPSLIDTRFEPLLMTYFRWITPKILKTQAKGLDRVRMLYGLPPLSDYLSGFTYGDRTLYADTPLISPTVNLPRNHAYIGPLSWTPDLAMPEFWSEIKESNRLVYVSLGSSGNQNLLPCILETLLNEKYKIVCQANKLAIDTSLYPDVYFAELLPGHKLAEKSTFVVTNGGSPSSYQALVHGVPLIGVPENMDQLLSITRIEQFGAGICLRADKINASNFKHAVQEIVKTDHYKKSAELISKECLTIDSQSVFLDTIYALLHERGVEHLDDIGKRRLTA